MLQLRKIRIEKKLSVQKLADLSGVHRRSIQGIEKRGDCMLSTAYTLAQTLEVSLNDFYDGEASE